MKSIFLSFVVLVSLTAGQAFAQTAKKTVRKQTKASVPKPVAAAKKVTTSVSAPAATAPVEKSSFDKFYERLGISYFGAYTSANLENGDYARAALSPEYGSENEDSYSHNLFNQINFAYNFGAKLKFNIVPRWTVFFTHPTDQDPGERGMVLLEDALVGFSGVLYSSDDKKFSWYTNPRMRLPTSHASRTSNNGGFGRLNYQLEWNNAFSYTFNEKWNVGLSIGNRFYIYDNRYNYSRHRILTNPSVVYTVNDTTKIEVNFEHELQNRRNWKSINGKEPKYEDVWQNFMVGVSHDLTPKLNVQPFVASFINDVPYSMQSYWLGLLVSYSIK